MNLKAQVVFEFECDDKKTMKEIVQNITEQIICDMNSYYQNTDDTAQMKRVEIKSIRRCL